MGENNENLRIELLPPEEKSRRGIKKNRRPYRAADYSKQGIAQQAESSQVKTFVKKSVSVTVRYFLAKLFTSILITVVSIIVFMLLDIPLAAVWGIAAGVGNAIPVFGQWIGMIIAVGGAWIATQSWKMALFALLTLIVLQILEEFVIEPLIIGKSTSIKPLLIIVIMLIAGAFFGFWGVLFAVPAAAIVKLAYEIFWLKKKD